MFLLSSLITGPSFMSISSLVLEFWQFSFIRDWLEIWKSEIPSSEFCGISGIWNKLGIPHLTRMFLINGYWMQQTTRVTAFTLSELLRENQRGLGGDDYPHNTQIKVNLIQLIQSKVEVEAPTIHKIIQEETTEIFIL